MNDDKLREACEKMARLLEAPHPGLMTWITRWRRNVEEIFHALGVREDASIDSVYSALIGAGLYDEKRGA